MNPPLLAPSLLAGDHAALGETARSVEALGLSWLHVDIMDAVLVMTVQPGFGGQSFRADMLPKIAQIAEWRTSRSLGFRLEVDGGIDLASAARCHAAGADTFVAGTSFFRAEDRGAFAATIAGL